MIAAYALLQLTLIVADKISLTLGIIQLFIGSLTWSLTFFLAYYFRQKLGLKGKNLLTKSIAANLIILIISLTLILGAFIIYIFWISSLNKWNLPLTISAFVIFIYLCFLIILSFYISLKELRHKYLKNHNQ
ncbi:hypothetical protein SAMN04488087_1645 [Rhodothermus profundi]|uniref:Uncharacterized protein n=2 Tax=Rhodothermus profundi TaxID=633813 RepID=A0A1M6UCK8_9BACT|nr:hypothetical protein SAMN04488087_1645 [Rhodothermus profundi]